MNIVSVLGLLVLLGLAWSMSYHRREVKLRPVCWGLGLQFVLALTILREDVWSHIGLSVLAGLIILYNLEEHHEDGRRNWRHTAAVLVGALVVGGLLTLLPSRWLATLGLVALILFVLNSMTPRLQKAQRYIGVAFLLCGVAWLITNGIYGEQVFSTFSTKVSAFLNLSDYGARFLFGNLATLEYNFPVRTGAGRASARSSPSSPADDHLLRRLSWRCSITSAMMQVVIESPWPDSCAGPSGPPARKPSPAPPTSSSARPRRRC